MKEKSLLIIAQPNRSSPSQWKEEEDQTRTLAVVSSLLNLVFVVEVVMKLIAFTPRGYWQSRRNRYDLFVTTLGVVWIILNYTLQVTGLAFWLHRYSDCTDPMVPTRWCGSSSTIPCK